MRATEDSRTALHHAVLGTDLHALELTNLLLTNGIDVDAVDKTGKSALILVLENCKNVNAIEMLRTLIVHQANVKLMHLHYQPRPKAADFVEPRSDSKPKADSKCSAAPDHPSEKVLVSRYSTLMVAVKAISNCRHVAEVVQTLLNAGAQVDVKPSFPERQNVLHMLAGFVKSHDISPTLLVLRQNVESTTFVHLMNKPMRVVIRLFTH